MYWTGIMAETLMYLHNPIVKNHEETERSFVQCGSFSKQQQSLKYSLLEELESALAA
jgi:hypothetical protein